MIKPYIEGRTLTNNVTLVSDNRLANIIMYSYAAKQVEGDYAEFGVFKGGGTELIAKINPEKVIHCIDSFEGLPAPVDVDKHNAGDFNQNMDDVQNMVNYFGEHHPNVIVYKGFSPAVFAALPDTPFAFVHIDVDMYTSVMDACEFFYPKMSKGGIMLFDDYKWNTTPGAEKAIHEYFADKQPEIAEELKYVNGKSHYQFIIIK